MLPVAIREIIDRQPFEAGSIDRLMLDRQMLFSPETRPSLYGSVPAPPHHADRPVLDAVVDTVAAELRQPSAKLLALMRWCHRIPFDFPRPGPSTIAGFYGDFSGYRWGGDEESVIQKGSPWPQELARLLIALLAQAGLTARMVFLYGATPPTIHTVVEAWLGDGWAACDLCANRCYVWPHHGFASAADLRSQPRLVDQQPEHGHNPCIDSALYRRFGISMSDEIDAPAEAYRLHSPVAGQNESLQVAARLFAA